MLTFASSITGNEQKVQHHYYDLHGNSLEQYDRIWATLYEYYGKYLPDVLTIEYIEGTASQFDPRQNQVKLAVRNLYSPTGNEIIAHESSHIALYHLTEGASILEQFRFFDEGQANILGAIATDTLEEYKRLALNVAAIQHHKGNVSFEKVQAWSSYYGYPGSGSSFAYDVGASFNFFIVDTYGEETLYQFFVDIGKTKDLTKTIHNIFNKSLKELETEWLQFLAAIETDQSLIQPMVVEMYPPHNAENVPTNIDEIHVHFNTDMQPIVCIRTPCQDTGICYKDAYWKTTKILALKVKGGLKSGYSYNLSLGVPQKCEYKSIVGIALPITPWHFTTQ
jgi:hypothetical protein